MNARRRNYLLHTQKNGQTGSEFCNELCRMANEGNLESMTMEELAVCKLITGMKDGELKNELIKLKDPTLKEARDENDNRV